MQAGLDYAAFFERWGLRIGARGMGGGLFAPTTATGGIGARIAFLSNVDTTEIPEVVTRHWLLGVELSADYLVRSDALPGFGLFGLALAVERPR